jgi:cell division septation protein DedD
MNTEESDITIGPLKLLGLFFMLVVICGVFFAIGYSLGKTSAREQALNDKTALNASTAAPVVSNPAAAKPSAGVVSKSEPDGNAGADLSNEPSSPDLTFFNAVKRSDRNTPATKGDSKATTKPEVKAAGPAVTDSSAAPVEVAAKTGPKAEAAPAITPAPGGGFVVQVAAVTREEDAAALAGALRKKNYSVFVVNNPAIHDKYYHVQVGPFPTLQDAETMKARLMGEGYNPIVKKS